MFLKSFAGELFECLCLNLKLNSDEATAQPPTHQFWANENEGFVRGMWHHVELQNDDLAMVHVLVNSTCVILCHALISHVVVPANEASRNTIRLHQLCTAGEPSPNQKCSSGDEK
jgi:hypothetical protein